MSLDPALPSFDRIRLATFNDLSRIATVAAAGFYYSPTFRFQRPHHAEFPEDTISSYWAEYKATIMNPACAVLVAEDTCIEGESEQVYEALRRSPMYSRTGDARAQVIVGVCSISLEPNSWRVGQFQTGTHVECPEPHALFNGLNRDQSTRALERYNAATAPAKSKFLARKMRLSTLAVHPAYWKRGHATRLVSWCTRLADLDNLPLGISAAPMGAKIAASAGFKEDEIVRIEQENVQGDSSSQGCPVELWVATRWPYQSPSDSSTTCSESPSTESM
ncbi:hypothetical protein P154DRAFT_356773 [Amniculicola lignicola CBS 123094]|uniref:N-acetyltransferase domain-containing protein n=1 Tax=Amniculicola lignicola CBS 123094 TaxID=1392246 RepID=A0A6A5WX04_9PLEO|nr:hypothetical protein P154DRAFT_356773 [Amniculicola lignicola CBS 123094]